MATPTYRVATLWDVEQLADCARDTMMEDDFFGAIYPRRREDPYHFRQWFKRRGRMRITDHNLVTIIAEMPVVENGKEVMKIVGFAHWEKYGKESVETRWNPVKACEHKLIAWEDWIFSYLEKKDTTIDLDMVANFRFDMEEIEKTFWVKDGKDHDRWHLQLLGVHPTARRKGIGARLVQEGLDRARRDGCDAGLEASPMGLPLYQSLGFEVIGHYQMNLKKPDGSSIPSPVLMWRNPEVANREA